MILRSGKVYQPNIKITKKVKKKKSSTKKEKKKKAIDEEW